MDETYHCFCCGGDFVKGDDVTARLEARARGVDADSPDIVTICDVCFTIMEGEMENNKTFLDRMHRWRLNLSPASAGERIMAKFGEYPHLRRGRIIVVGDVTVEIVLDGSDAVSRIDLWRLYPESPQAS